MNMSYCRFHNTCADLIDCIEAIGCGDELSESEQMKAKQLYELAQRYIDMYEFNH